MESVQHDRILVFTMPGFGIETLRTLIDEPGCSPERLVIGLIGRSPPIWRYLAARLRNLWRGRYHPQTVLVDLTLSSWAAQRWLQGRGFSWRWVENEEAARALRIAICPRLTLTITSRIIFKAETLSAVPGDWFNVHPGLLPQYAGASPVPYMFRDGVAGCTIHMMAERVDAGAIVDLAPMQGDLGQDGGEFFFERLSAHTAHRVGGLVRRWDRGELEAQSQDATALRYCSSSRLAADRQLDWRAPPESLARWVQALVPLALAYFIDEKGRKVEIIAARPLPSTLKAEPGCALRLEGRRLDVACQEGVVSLQCRVRPRVSVGQVLPLPQDLAK